MIYVPGPTSNDPPKIVAAIVPKDDPIMRFMREEDPDHVEVRYFATMHLSDGRVDTREWGQGLASFEWAWGPAVWVCPD